MKTGRFRFTHETDTPAVLRNARLVVTCEEGAGPDWVQVADADNLEDLELRLASDRTPVEGRVLDLEGNPVAGATVQVAAVRAMHSDDLEDYVRMVKAGNGPNFRFDKYLPRSSLFDDGEDGRRGTLSFDRHGENGGWSTWPSLAGRSSAPTCSS